MSDFSESDFIEVCSRLGAIRSTDGNWIAKCPCHQDESPSLSLAFKANKLLVNCFSGCEQNLVYKTIISLVKTTHKPVVTHKPSQRIFRYDNEYGELYGEVIRDDFLKEGVPAKKIWSRRWDNDKKAWARKASGSYVGMSAETSPPFGLASLLVADPSRIVFIVEGEPKAQQLISHGLVAISNQGGAKKWNHANNRFLLGRSVCLIPDNDEVGYEHISLVAKSLRESGITKIKILELGDFVPPKGDSVDFINKYGIDKFKELVKTQTKDMPDISMGATPSSMLAKEVESTSPGEVKIRSATMLDYQEFFRATLPIRRDMFSGDGMYWDEKVELWSPVLNKLSTYKVLAEEITKEKTSMIKFQSSKIEDQLNHYIDSLPLELLVEIQKWDGVDRIRQMSECIEFSETTTATTDHFDYFIKDWWVNTFKRAFNPREQNRMIILQGTQGLGKDTWVDTMTSALGQFCAPFQVTENANKDMYLQLSSCMVLKIGEFDKTARIHVSILKDIITSVNTQIRGSYERRAKIRPSRSSFISTANIKDLLRDPTGNRRYLVFFLKNIKKTFPKYDKQYSEQILAQAYHYYQNGIEHNPDVVAEAESEMKRLIERLTPESPEQIVIETYQLEIENLINNSEMDHRILIDMNGYLNQDQMNLVTNNISKLTELSHKVVRSILKQNGYQRVIREVKNGAASVKRVWLLDPTTEKIGQEILSPKEEEKLKEKLEKWN